MSSSTTTPEPPERPERPEPPGDGSPSVGERAPDFTLRDQHGTPVSLAELCEEKAVLLVFYPYAFSGVCTKELTGFRDRLDDFASDRTALVAVSCDPKYALRAFADVDDLRFPLLSDFWPHGQVAAAYGVFDEVKGCPRRSSFVIDRRGIVRWAVHQAMAEERDLEEHARALAAAV